MNDLFVALGIEAWKPFAAAVFAPPLPFLLLILAGARLMYRSRALAWLLLVTGVAGVWAMSTYAVGDTLVRLLTTPPRALAAADIAELRRAPKTAIVVLGGGRRTLAPEYGISSLSPLSAERLRYGVWLARETGLPLAFSGGIGHGAAPGPSEAEIAARVAEREFRQPLRWTEGDSRDTAENAQRTLQLLKPAGIERIVVVTNDFHMRRAIGDFERAADRAGARLTLTAAPMGLPAPGNYTTLDWLPSREGYAATLLALHEWAGRLAGA